MQGSDEIARLEVPDKKCEMIEIHDRLHSKTLGLTAESLYRKPYIAASKPGVGKPEPFLAGNPGTKGPFRTTGITSGNEASLLSPQCHCWIGKHSATAG
jgi:hypothetical protein